LPALLLNLHQSRQDFAQARAPDAGQVPGRMSLTQTRYGPKVE
jgi:hypothetical protein